MPLDISDLNLSGVAPTTQGEWASLAQIDSDNATFPALSVTRVRYNDLGTAFPTTEIYPRYAVLTYLVNDIPITNTVTVSAVELTTSTVLGVTASATLPVSVVSSTVLTTSANASDTAVVTVFNSSGSQQTFVANNPQRTGFMVVNKADTDLYVKFGTTVTTTNFSFIISPQSMYELPLSYYSGQIVGIWTDSPTGSAFVTEIS